VAELTPDRVASYITLRGSTSNHPLWGMASRAGGFILGDGSVVARPVRRHAGLEMWTVDPGGSTASPER
jgi:hypothetical protein